MESRIYEFIDFGEENYLQYIGIAGTYTSYVSMIFNVFVFVILCRKTLISPATILMQGLAAADFLTAFSSYGLEPLFQSNYVCEVIEDSKQHNDKMMQACSLTYPQCVVATHLSILSATFHTASYMITTCLGIQKVIAIRFPIWTKCKLSNRKSIICCVSCFWLSLAISLPRHVAVDYEPSEYLNRCKISVNVLFLEYSSLYYLMIQAVLVTSCCLVMLMSTIFIIYKLGNNKLRARMTQQRVQERRSIIMVVIVLVVFLISEVPRVIIYAWFCVKYIVSNIFFHPLDMAMVVARYEYGIALLMGLATSIDDLFNAIENFEYFSNIVEGVKLFTIVGCLSNFVIYIIMGKKMRAAISSIFGKPTRRSNVIDDESTLSARNATSIY
ncbi:Hypothetical predicted protein [Mytilus galloprovincialis]|uniref:G-protein coupled receptors family 1 profile domain-containing protein n=1 Tax=Mytilus galloprovincialis TaxID=29158 RepID=A0A8B6DKM2_MYTGA|nr:Hypothetical predicted protein [Mytilus galloprovincialis]